MPLGTAPQREGCCPYSPLALAGPSCNLKLQSLLENYGTIAVTHGFRPHEPANKYFT